jgi:hypothetical protein
MMLQLSISAQVLLPLNNSFSKNGDKEIYSGARPFTFTSSKPLFTKLYTANDTGIVLCESKGSWLRRKLLSEDLLKADTADFSIRLNPLVDFSVTRDSHDKNHFRNTRGILLNGNIGKTLYFRTSYNETQASFADYITDFISKYRVVPGQTRVKDFKSKSYDYGVATALVSWSPKNFLNFTFGHDKVFFGDGYRSLLLSDFASPYPFMRITATFGKFQNVTMYTSFQNLKEGNVIPDASTDWDAGYVKKTGTFHYLTYTPINSLQISLFEGTIWKANATGYVFNIDKFNPIPLFHTAEFGLNNKNNVLCGINFNYRIMYSLRIYGQAIIDNFSLKHSPGNGYREDKTGFQFGFKTYDPFQLKNLTLQGELNSVRPYTYSHTYPIQSYSHYNQSLAHPLGANFMEALAISTYQYKRILARAKFIYAKYGSDSALTNYGKDIFSGFAPTSEITGNTTGQGIRTILTYSEFQLCWLLNPHTNMNVFAGIAFRNEQKSGIAVKDKLLFFGIRTSLSNEYFDF